MKHIQRLTPIVFSHTHLSALRYKKKLIDAFATVIDRGVFLAGEENEKLTQKLAAQFGPHITLVGSGHDALRIALEALSLAPTDEVIFPVNAYPTAFPIAQSGITPIPVDVDMHGQLDLAATQKAITKRTKVIVLVHLYGLTADIGAFQTLCARHNLILIEDTAQAFGGTWNRRPLGSLGDIGCLSFYPTKNLGSLGDGGAIWTKHTLLHRRIEQRVQYGERKRYHSLFVSGHSRLPELQAAGLNVYLGHQSADGLAKKKIARWYKTALQAPALQPYVRLLASHATSDPVLHLFVIAAAKRDKLRTYLLERGIPTMIHYPTPIHRVPAFAYLGHTTHDFPMAERLQKTIVSLPFHPYLTKKQVEYIVGTIKKFYALHHENA